MNSESLYALMGRREDFRFVTGQGCYTADIVPDNALHAVFVRSPIARGHLRHDAGQKFLVTIKTLFCNRPNAVNCLCASILPVPKKVQAITAYTPLI